MCERTHSESRTKARSLGPYFGVLPTVLFLFIWTIYPMLNSLFLSVHGWVLSRPEEIPFVGFRNYWSLLFGRESSYFLSSMATTLLFTLAVVTAEFLIGLGLALLVNDARAEKFFRVCWTLPMLATPISVGMMWRYMYMPEFGIVNYIFGLLGVPIKAPMTQIPWALPALMIVDIWQWTPFVFLTLLTGLKTLPKEPFEAAEVDGATSWQVFRRLKLSLLKPVILIVLILRTTDTLRIFDVVWVMTAGGPGHYTEVLSVYIFRVSWKILDIGLATASSWIVTLMMIVVGQLFVRSLKYEEM